MAWMQISGASLIVISLIVIAGLDPAIHLS
jgi:hypothetical protein